MGLSNNFLEYQGKEWEKEDIITVGDTVRRIRKDHLGQLALYAYQQGIALRPMTEMWGLMGIVMSIILNNFRIVDVSKDKVGRYIKLEVRLPNGDCIIRWDLDEFTYKQIKEIVSKKHFDSLATDYLYEIVPYVSTYQEKPKSMPYYRGAIRCIQGNRAARIEFPCSERFAGNMEWFSKEVTKVEDIKHLVWENFLR